MLFSRKSKNRKGQNTTTKRPETFKRQKNSSARSVTSTTSESTAVTSSSSTNLSSSIHSQQHLLVLEARSVRFSKVLTVKQTLHVHDYTPEEIAACWYDRFESEEIMNEAKFVVSLYEDRTLLVDENKYPKRGLELYMAMPSDNTAKQSRRAVLEEQAKLKELSTSTAATASTTPPSSSKSTAKMSAKRQQRIQARIESAYTVYTQGSRMQARLLALSDELAISEDSIASTTSMARRLSMCPLPSSSVRVQKETGVPV